MFPNLSAEPTVAGKIALFELQGMEDTELRFPEHLEFLAGFEFVRLCGMPRSFFDENSTAQEINTTLVALLSGLFALGEPFCCLMDVTPNQVFIYLGGRRTEMTNGCDVIHGILKGRWGSGFIANDSSASDRLRELTRSMSCGCVSGIPVNISPHGKESKRLPVDTWLKALAHERWSWLVCGFCIPRQQIADGRSALIAEIAALKTNVIREDILYEERRLAELYQSHLEAGLKRCDHGRNHGIWQAGAWLFAPEEQTVRRGLGVIGSTLSVGPPRVQPLRTHNCRRNSSLSPSFVNLLTSSEMALLLPLPSHEVPGFRVSRVAEFDTDAEAVQEIGAIALGQIIRNNEPCVNRFSIPTADLSRHGLVAGVTGSGKTTTCISILRQLKQQNIPFLVIESAKAEYRSLLADPQFSDLMIFTLGDETPGRSAPFRINPFEVPEGTLVQSHLDYLKALFRASFVMYAPMPYVLEEALHEVYCDKGWNLSTNENPRGRDPLAFPTLSDLYEKIGEVVARTGYDERISKDILAGLRTRINNLRLGAKGLMLDTRHSVPIAELLNSQVVLELHRLGNDDEKAFLIGLLLTRIYEHYESDVLREPITGGLRHLTLIEEAHRLLKHVPEEASEVEGNVRGKAVETFCAMLSEVRAYGEGVLVAEQIPTKLARDLLKNTNIKIMHRLVARDDRDMLGDTMNLSDEQKRHATTLRRGEAIVYAEGADAPFLVAMPVHKEKVNSGMTAGDRVTANAIDAQMQKLFFSRFPRLLRPLAACGACSADTAVCATLCQALAGISASDTMSLVTGRLIVSLAFGSCNTTVAEELDRLMPLLANSVGSTTARYCLLCQAAFRSVERQGILYHYPFSRMHELLALLYCSLKRLVDGDPLAGQHEISNLLHSLRRTDVVPFSGCIYCAKRCLYRFEVSLLLNDRKFNADFDFAVRGIKDDDEMWQEIASLAMRASQQLAPEDDRELIRALATCYLSQKVAFNGYAPRVQEKVIRNFLAAMKKE